MAGLVAACLATGCDRPGATVQPADTADPTDPATASVADCGDAGLRFDSHEFVPPDARLLVAVVLEPPEDTASATAMVVRAASDVDESGALAAWPIVSRFALQGLGIEIPSLTGALAELGLRPASISAAHGSDGLTAWLVPSTCSVDQLTSAAMAQWKMTFRVAIGARIGHSSDAFFPFDLVALSGDRLALAPRGRGGEVFEWLSARTGPDDDDPKTAAALIDTLDPAPIRAATIGAGLVAPEPPTSAGKAPMAESADGGRGSPAETTAAGSGRWLRATGAELTVDGDTLPRR
jgi:hypothetical protein